MPHPAAYQARPLRYGVHSQTGEVVSGLMQDSPVDLARGATGGFISRLINRYKPSVVACVPRHTPRAVADIASHECGGRNSWQTPRALAKRKQPVSG